MSEVSFSILDILNLSGQGTTFPTINGSDPNLFPVSLFGDSTSSYEWPHNPSNSLVMPQCGCTSPPVLSDSSHPAGSLETSNGVVTTAGGYTIEPLGQFEWKITGPDGKSTRVWGDPHVVEGDGGKWDFKRDSTFVLPDGTRINVTTKPWGNNGQTVTGSLEIISGNERVLISDVDKGKGKIGDITQDGFEHVNSFGSKDVFVMGSETDDWSYQGREIIGSEKGGEKFKLGNELAPGRPNATDTLLAFLRELFGDWDPNWRPNDYGSNPYYDPIFGSDNDSADYDPVFHKNCLRNSFGDMSDMFQTLDNLTSINDSFCHNRHRTVLV